MPTKKSGEPKIPAGQVLHLAALVEYGEGAVVSRTLVENDAGTVTLFAFDEGQGLSEHTAPFDALVQVVDGQGEFVIGGESCRMGVGHIVLMPANVPHAVRAISRFKMLLTMLRAKSAAT
jgi:quercetin dioxygenase-like cupin family protein